MHAAMPTDHEELHDMLPCEPAHPQHVQAQISVINHSLATHTWSRWGAALILTPLQGYQALVETLQKPTDRQQLERSSCLLVYALRLDSECATWQQTRLYPTLLQLLRSDLQQHGELVSTHIVEAVAIIATKDGGACSSLLDLGIITYVSVLYFWPHRQLFALTLLSKTSVDSVIPANIK